MKITIIDGHPDPSPQRLNHALADRYAARALEEGHEVRRIDVATLQFPIMRAPQEFYEGTAPEAIARAQRDIAWAEHLVFVFPLWMSDMPALLKGFLEQTFRPGFALEANRRAPFPRRLLKGRSARVVVTMGMPAAMYRYVMGEYMLKMLRRLFAFAGIGPTGETILGSVMNASERCRTKWFETIDRAVDEDLSRRPHRIASALRASAAAGAIAAAGYLAYAATSWSRYGAAKPPKEPDTLLDRYMTDYEVVLRHAVVVNAPASTTFSAVRISDLDRSPIVRLLFGTRELLLRARTGDAAPAALPFDKLAEIGWSMLAEEPGKEMVLGTVTAPWDRHSRMRAVPAAEFADFKEPGYAKIVLGIRIEPVSSEHCELRSETRVQTTDPIARARFRRYWALLSPGMEIIRRVILQQVKADAESTWESVRARESKTPTQS